MPSTGRTSWIGAAAVGVVILGGSISTRTLEAMREWDVWHELVVESPFGPVRVVLTERGIFAAERDAPAAEFRRRVRERLDGATPSAAAADDLPARVRTLLPRVREA